MSFNSFKNPTQPSRMKLAASLEDIPDFENNEQTSKKLFRPLEASNIDKYPRNTPKILSELTNQLKTLKFFNKKSKQLDSNEDLRERALALIDGNNQLNSVLESDIALQYLETQDISPKRNVQNLHNHKKEMIEANVELNKRLFHRFFLNSHTEKRSNPETLKELSKELDRLKGNSFDKENLNFYKTSHSFIEIQSAEFLNCEENVGYDKLIEDYKGLASENMNLKQKKQDIEDKYNNIIEENGNLKRANLLLLTELETINQELKDSRECLLTKPCDFSIEKIRNEEFKLLDEKINQLMQENEGLKQRNSENEKAMNILIRGAKDSGIVISQNIEKYGNFSLDQNKFNEIKDRELDFLTNCKDFRESNINYSKISVHGKCNKIIEDLKNELMEAHLCIADLENKIKTFRVKKNPGGDIIIKNYDVSVN